MTVETRQATAEEARQRADRIKLGGEVLWQLIVEAYYSRDWLALGYGSWDEYCTREHGHLRLRLPREDQQEKVHSLRDAGLSLRAIAAATQQSHTQVRRELSGGTSTQENVPPDKPRVSNSIGQRGIDGKVYPPRRQPQPEPLDPESWPTGNDRDMPRPDPPPRPVPVMLTLRTHAGEEVPYPKPQAKATFNETAGDGISWAAWSWNPVTGCLHGCDYCYARAIATRFTDTYPAGFTPLFHDERLDAPANTTVPAAHRDDPAYKRVFVCSMADLYGRWVPDEWIKQVHESMLASPQWEYLLLTKFPARYAGLDIPPGAWVGTSVDEQKRVRIAENAFREISGAAVRWLSLEPLREPLQFSDLSMFDWVVIGAQTETRQPDGYVAAFAPPAEWVVRITAQAMEAGCKVHWKPNLRTSPGMRWLDQYPADGLCPGSRWTTLSMTTRRSSGQARQHSGSTHGAVTTWRSICSTGTSRQRSLPSGDRRSGPGSCLMPASGRPSRVVITCPATLWITLRGTRCWRSGKRSRNASNDGWKSTVIPAQRRDASQDALIVRLMARLETVQKTPPFPRPLRDVRGRAPALRARTQTRAPRRFPMRKSIRSNRTAAPTAAKPAAARRKTAATRRHHDRP